MSESLYEFIQGCIDHLKTSNQQDTKSISFVLASNDWSQTVIYAEGSVYIDEGWTHDNLKGGRNKISE
jgi:hypothetical protein